MRRVFLFERVDRVEQGDNTLVLRVDGAQHFLDPVIRFTADIHEKVTGVDGGDVAGRWIIVVAFLPRAQKQRERHAVHPRRQLPQKVILRKHRAHDAQPRVVGGCGGTAAEG